LTIRNSGDAALAISALSLSGADANQFSVAQGTCGSLTPTIAAGGSCALALTFAPTSAGAKSATLTITHDATGSPTTVSLAGLSSTQIPTLSEWGMIALGALLLSTMIWTMRRRSRA
jgi:hypothetical protein